MSGIIWRRAVSFLALWFSIVSLNVNAQQNQAVPTQITPTPVVFPPPQFGEPELICPYFREGKSGVNWRGIVIGRSSQANLEQQLQQIGNYEMIFPIEGTLVPIGINR